MAISVRRTSPRRRQSPGLFARRSADCGAVMCAPAPPGDYSIARKYVDQRRILGVSVGPHIMQIYRPQLQDKVDATSGDLSARIGQRVTIAGMLEARRKTPASDGCEMMFLTMDDEFGLFEATLSPDRAALHRFENYGPYITTGTVAEKHGTISIEAEEVLQ